MAFANVVPSSVPSIQSLCQQKECGGKMATHFLNAWKDAEATISETIVGQGFGVGMLEAAAGLVGIRLRVRELVLAGTLTITPSIFSHWFLHSSTAPSYIDKLGQYLSESACEEITQWCAHNLKGQTVDWPSKVILASFD